MADLFLELIKGLWIILPAYVANSVAPLANGKKPIDFGKNFIDGRRIFGKGKTWEGTAYAVLLGTLVGLFQIYLHPHVSGWLEFPYLTIAAAFFIALAAMIGDMLGSFMKRRLNIESGESAPILDQINFLIVALPVAQLFVAVSLESMALLFVITPLLHSSASFIGYHLGLKRVPW